MSSIVVSGDTSGAITIAAPAVAGTNTLTLPANTGTIVTTGSSAVVTPTMMTQPLNLGTAVATTSGSSFDFTSIPSWVKRITVMFASVSSSGSSPYLIQIGAGSLQTSGYLGSSSYVGGTPATVNMSTGFYINTDDANEVNHGMATLCLLNSATGLWCMTALIAHSNEAYTTFSGGSKTLSGTLDMLRVTTANGTDTFDAGSINILYE